MSDITIKSTGTLINELITEMIRCYLAQEDMPYSETDEERAELSRIAQESNARRAALTRAIDERLDTEAWSMPEKSYG